MPRFDGDPKTDATVWGSVGEGCQLSGFCGDLPPWLSGLTLSLSRSAVSLAGGVGSTSAACRVRFLHATTTRLHYRAGTEGSLVSSFICDRPSHPDWGRLVVVTAAGADNR